MMSLARRNVDDLTATLIRAGLPTSRQIWTGQPDSLVELLDEIASFVLTRTKQPPG